MNKITNINVLNTSYYILYETFLSGVKTLFLLTLLVFGLSACQTRITDENWPENIPDKAYFVQTGSTLIGEQDPDFDKELNTYLLWVKRFYIGSIIYPLGWNEMSAQFLESLPATDNSQADVTNRLAILGRDIAAEWSQESSKSKISSGNVATWGAALRKAAERGEQLTFLTQVEDDVSKLLTGELSSNMIDQDRYYPEQDYDNF
ncbi:MAG: hypothetical protein AAF197_09465 [Pseudomonadota bacterium]